MIGIASILEWGDAQDAIAAAGTWIERDGQIVGARTYDPDIDAELQFDIYDLMMRESTSCLR